MTLAKKRTTEKALAAFNTGAIDAIDSLQDASVDLAKYLSSHELELEEYEKDNLCDAVHGLTVQIIALNGAVKDDDLEIETKKLLLKNALSSIKLCQKFMRVSKDL